MSLNFQNTVFNRDMRETPENCEVIWLGLGCFWGAERLFWQTPGVVNTAVGYAGGATPNPTYDEVCTGLTGHTEIVQVVYDPQVVDLAALLKVFWEAHDPTQGMRQGADIGTQYRSAIYGNASQVEQARESALVYQRHLNEKGMSAITTEMINAPSFYYAEEYHQQYLQKNPNGYCGLKGTGVVCPI
jgi:peptide-methionine (S)-S-oxide reductase